MPINTSEILSLVTQVCDEEQLRVPIKESLKGGAIAFATTTVGGLLAGPVGLAIGTVHQFFSLAVHHVIISFRSDVHVFGLNSNFCSHIYSLIHIILLSNEFSVEQTDTSSCLASVCEDTLSLT